MQAETDLARQIVQLLQDIIIQGADLIYREQRRSAHGWHVTYPYSCAIMVFSIVDGSLTLVPATEIMGQGTPERWEAPELSKIAGGLRQLSHWQHQLGSDAEDNLYLIRNHLRPLALQILNLVSSSYGFWPRNEDSSLLIVPSLSPQTTELFPNKAVDCDELSLGDKLDAPELKALVDEFNLLLARLVRVANRPKVAPVIFSLPLPPNDNAPREAGGTGSDLGAATIAEDVARENKNLVRKALITAIKAHPGAGYKFILDVLDHSDRILMEDALFKKWVRQYGIQCWADIALHKTPRQYFQQFISKLKKI
jgi:hypothetical protein